MFSGEYIVFEWSINIEKNVYGITFERDENGDLVDGSVGYTCQSCGDFFTDKHKYEMLLNGEWRATAKPSEVGYYSYHISSLYAPPGMYDWEHYVRQWLKANPVNEPVKHKEMQTFVNLVLGETYEEAGEAPKANQLQKNTRDYQVNELPEQLSERDGNGKIVLLTCGSDLNGKVEDARLDYEIVAWTESGASYSIAHGSIGTFIPRESQKKNKVDRVHWSYEESAQNSVWPVFEEVIDRIFETDTDRRMKISMTGVDTGHYTTYAYSFIENI